MYMYERTTVQRSLFLEVVLQWRLGEYLLAVVRVWTHHQELVEETARREEHVWARRSYRRVTRKPKERESEERNARRRQETRKQTAQVTPVGGWRVTRSSRSYFWAWQVEGKHRLQLCLLSPVVCSLLGLLKSASTPYVQGEGTNENLKKAKR